jgi:hypothetical protein
MPHSLTLRIVKEPILGMRWQACKIELDSKLEWTAWRQALD